jgi:hypothetical protein
VAADFAAVGVGAHVVGVVDDARCDPDDAAVDGFEGFQVLRTGGGCVCHTGTSSVDFGFWVLGFGLQAVDFGFWILDFGFWILDWKMCVCCANDTIDGRR